MDYYEIAVQTAGLGEEDKDIIMAELAEAGCESFTDTSDALQAYVPEKLYNKESIALILEKRNIGFTVTKIPAQNWNAVWESNFEPVVIDGRCVVRASFHKDLPVCPYDILIDPKMAFGTGHHETTSLVVTAMLDKNFKGLSVLDMGCGSGILAILASKMGAGHVTAIDFDPWSQENSLENMQKNNITNGTVLLGDASVIPDTEYDVLLANINRNVLLEDIRHYNSHVKKGGWILLSGFYTQDVDIIKTEASRNNWEFVSFKEKNNWVVAEFRK